MKKFAFPFLCLSLYLSYANARNAIDVVKDINEQTCKARQTCFTPHDAKRLQEGHDLLSGEKSNLSSKRATSNERKIVMEFCLHKAIREKAKPAAPYMGKRTDAEIKHAAALYTMEWIAYYMVKNPESYLQTTHHISNTILTQGKIFKACSKHVDPSVYFFFKSRVMQNLEHSLLLTGSHFVYAYQDLSAGYSDCDHAWLAESSQILRHTSPATLPDVKGHLTNGYKGIYDKTGYPLALMKPKKPLNKSMGSRLWENELLATKVSKITGFQTVISPVYDYDDDYTIEPFLSLIPPQYRKNLETDKDMRDILNFVSTLFNCKYPGDAFNFTDVSTEDISKQSMRLSIVNNYFSPGAWGLKLIPNKNKFLSILDSQNLVLFIGALRVLNLRNAHADNIAIRIMPGGKIHLAHFDLEYCFDLGDCTLKHRVNSAYVWAGLLKGDVNLTSFRPKNLEKTPKKIRKMLSYAPLSLKKALSINTFFWKEPHKKNILMFLYDLSRYENGNSLNDACWDKFLMPSFLHFRNIPHAPLPSYWAQMGRNRHTKYEYPVEESYYTNKFPGVTSSHLNA